MSRLILIGCGKLKRDVASAASDLYCGSMFQARRKYAESHGQYLIMSAVHGLVSPDTVIAPYDRVISDLSPLDQIAWSSAIVRQLCEIIDNDELTFPALRKIHCELHAGADYSERLFDVLIAAGFSASWPVRGMSQGSQMQWYSQNTPRTRAAV